MIPIREGFVDVPGGRVWVRIVGPDAPGTPLLALHGGPGVPSDYLEPLEALAGERPVIRYDQLGCGRSDIPEDAALWTLPRFLEELRILRETLRLRELHLFGNSWGSLLAVRHAALHPEGIRSLLLSGPALDAARFARDARSFLRELSEEDQATVAEMEAAGDYENPRYQAVVERVYHRHVCRPEPPPDCAARSFARISLPVYLRMWGPSEFTVTGNLRKEDATPLLPELPMRILFLCGEHDEATPETTRGYAALCRRAETVVLPGTSHLHIDEDPEACLREIRRFLHLVEDAAKRRSP